MRLVKRKKEYISIALPLQTFGEYLQITSIRNWVVSQNSWKAMKTTLQIAFEETIFTTNIKSTPRTINMDEGKKVKEGKKKVKSLE